jgi:hypothetical protein
MKTSFETIPDLIRKQIKKYLDDPIRYNFNDIQNDIWVKIQNNLYSIKMFIDTASRFRFSSQFAAASDDAHDLWVAREIDRAMQERFVDSYKLRHKIKINFRYHENEYYTILLKIELKNPESVFFIDEENSGEWISEKIAGNYGKLYKVIKQYSPVDLIELTKKTRFLTAKDRNYLLQKLIEEKLIFEEKTSVGSKKQRKIFTINESTRLEDAVFMPDMPEGLEIETESEELMPERFYQQQNGSENLKKSMKKKKEKLSRIDASNFHESTMMQALFKIAGKAIEYVHQIYPRLVYVVKITVEGENIDVMEFKAQTHSIVGGHYIEGFPEDFYSRVKQTPYKVFMFGYLQFVRVEHSEYQQPSLYDGEHIINNKKVYVEIDFKESKTHDNNEIIEKLPEKFEQYFNNMEDSE